MILEKIHNFNVEIEDMIAEKKMDYIDAIILWCEANKVEVEYAAVMVKNNINLRSKVQAEAEALNIIKKTATLPV
jgi:hypothetical protein